MSACSVKFFTWDLTLKIERTLTHFNKKTLQCQRQEHRDRGKVSAELHSQALGATHQLDPRTAQLPPRYLEPLSQKGFPYHQKKEGETLDFRKANLSQIALLFWAVMLTRNLVPETPLPLTKLSSLEREAQQSPRM